MGSSFQDDAEFWADGNVGGDDARDDQQQRNGNDIRERGFSVVQDEWRDVERDAKRVGANQEPHPVEQREQSEPRRSRLRRRTTAESPSVNRPIAPSAVPSTSGSASARSIARTSARVI